MPADPDANDRSGRTPLGLDRRSFVKGAVTAAVAGVALEGTFLLGAPLVAQPQEGPFTVPYVGAKKVAGPAPRAEPLLPVHVNGDGFVEGRATLEGTDIRPWFRFCGREANAALGELHAADERLRYYRTAYDPQPRSKQWYGDKVPDEGVGEPVRASDFDPYANVSSPDDIHGAMVAWRSQSTKESTSIIALLLRIPDGMRTNMAYKDVSPGTVLVAGLSQGFLAFVAYCTHFCCLNNWHETPQYTRAVGLPNTLFCTCHGSAYDPFTLVRNTFLYESGHAEAYSPPS